jgi:hypothetical protein
MKQSTKIPIVVLTLIGSFVFMLSCEKQSPNPEATKPQENTKPPVVTVTTSEISEIKPTGAVSGGIVSVNDGYEITERGIVWGTAENPTIDSRKTIDGSGTGSFSSIITGLTENTYYYVRAYAVAGEVITYGKQISFRTPSPDEPGFPGEPRYDATSFISGNKRYFGLGDYPSSSDFWEYDLTTGTWTRKADFPVDGLTTAVGFSVGTKIYVGTGWTFTNGYVSNSNEFREYDPDTDTWTEKASLPGDGRGQAIGFSIGNKGYIGAGNYSDGIGGAMLTDLWEWDQSTNEWTRKADYPGPVTPSFGFSKGTKGYFVSSDSLEIWEWDQATDYWNKLEAMP